VFSHAILGVNDLEISKKFYDAVLDTLDIGPGFAKKTDMPSRCKPAGRARLRPEDRSESVPRTKFRIVCSWCHSALDFQRSSLTFSQFNQSRKSLRFHFELEYRPK